MKKIVFVLQNLVGGGSEKVAIQLMNNLDRNKFSVDLILFEKRGVFLDLLKEDINVITYPQKNLLIKLYLTMKAFKKYELVFSQLLLGKILGILIYVSSAFIKVNFFYRETNMFEQLKFEASNLTKFISLIYYRICYLKTNVIVAQSSDMEKDLLVINSKLKSKIRLINNPIKENINIKNNLNQSKKLNLIAIGRLEYQKGFDMLIESLSKIKKIDFNLLIFGEGKEEVNLKKLIQQNNLQQKIELRGFEKNVNFYLENADFLISSSRYEGFPNVVLEANILGIPVIANEYKGGINEIIISKINGEIIDITNSKELEKSLKVKYEKQKIINLTKQRYSIQKIIAEYEKIFECDN